MAVVVLLVRLRGVVGLELLTGFVEAGHHILAFLGRDGPVDHAVEEKDRCFDLLPPFLCVFLLARAGALSGFVLASFG